MKTKITIAEMLVDTQRTSSFPLRFHKIQMTLRNILVAISVTRMHNKLQKMNIMNTSKKKVAPMLN
jgi:hypothetical protein